MLFLLLITPFMKKIFVILFIVCALYACNASKDDKNETPVTTFPAASENVSEEFALIKKYDCAVCHRKDEKLQGPSYVSIAQKYQTKKDVVPYLSKKIIEGGVGVWGQVPMNAHPGMPQSDAEDLATYIISVK